MSTRYVGIDVATGPVVELMQRFSAEFPEFTFAAIPRAYIEGLQNLPVHGGLPVLVLWLGTSIGNLESPEAFAVLTASRRAVGGARSIVTGIDLKKDRATLESANNDSKGVTAPFKMNILARISRDLGGRFDPTSFAHRAFYNEPQSRIEMHLVSEAQQEILIRDLALRVPFEAGEANHTENSHNVRAPTSSILQMRVGWC